VSRDRKQFLVGQVIDQGFAGWVLLNRAFGVVENAAEDRRWINLPDEPYRVGSALGAPLLYSDVALGVMTLMHGEPYHFSDRDIELVRLLHDQMALLVENARLHSQYRLVSEP
jgi:sigma-B regulation protein RsbU (phosphoserine phosphatase)